MNVLMCQDGKTTSGQTWARLRNLTHVMKKMILISHVSINCHVNFEQTFKNVAKGKHKLGIICIISSQSTKKFEGTLFFAKLKNLY